MGHLLKRFCLNPKCKKSMLVKSADVARGWGLFCSKECKAINQCLPGGRGRVRHAQTHITMNDHKPQKKAGSPFDKPPVDTSFDDYDAICAEEDRKGK